MSFGNFSFLFSSFYSHSFLSFPESFIRTSVTFTRTAPLVHVSYCVFTFVGGYLILPVPLGHDPFAGFHGVLGQRLDRHDSLSFGLR